MSRKKDLFLLIPLALVIAGIVLYAWQRRYRSVTEKLLIRLNGTSFLAASVENNGSCSLTTGGLRNAVILDENGKEISSTELSVGDYVMITTDNYVLYSYPSQFPNVYKVRKTGRSDTALAEQIYQEYQAEMQAFENYTSKKA